MNALFILALTLFCTLLGAVSGEVLHVDLRLSAALGAIVGIILSLLAYDLVSDHSFDSDLKKLKTEADRWPDKLF